MASIYDHRNRAMGRTLRKRCAKCGRVGWYSGRQRRCRRWAFGRGSYSCYGDLMTTKRRRREGPTEADALRDAIAAASMIDPETAEAAERIRAVARRKLAHAERKLKEAVSDLKRTTTRLGQWQARAARYAKRSAVSNADVKAERDRRRQKGVASP
jgi:hypothetical protein